MAKDATSAVPKIVVFETVMFRSWFGAGIVRRSRTATYTPSLIEVSSHPKLSGPVGRRQPSISLVRMSKTSLYRALPASRRVTLVHHAIANHRGTKALYAQRLVAKGGGFRAATLITWSADRLAKEVVRLNAETAQDELDLLQLLYVDLEPSIQITFLDAAGVTHENGVIAEGVEAPYASADAVAKAAAAVTAAHGDDGQHYLKVLVKYNLAAWPGLDTVVTD